MRKNIHVRHGNYHNYYGIRSDESRSDILRNQLVSLWNEMQPEYIDEGKVIHMLDVGCNSGVFTDKAYRILRDVTNRQVRALGIDLDAELCKRASDNYPEIKFICGNMLNIGTCADANEVDPIAQSMLKLGIEQFDVIYCLSVLMYIHLNGGDAGLRAVLNYICAKGKLLILELQSWRKYRDQLRRLKRDGQDEYPLFEGLEWRGNSGKLEEFIKNYVVAKGFEVLESVERNEFDRQLLFFKKKK